MTISVVVPVYNSSESLPRLVERLQPVLAGLGVPYELVLVNDGSCDNSWAVIQDLVRKYPWIRGLNMMRNYGQHNALVCGVRAARHDLIVTMDDDLQHPPEEIPVLLKRLNEGFDVVYGTPQEEPHGLWRGLASKVVKISMKMAMGVDSARYVSAFRAFRTSLRDAFAGYNAPYVCLDVLLTWGTARFTHVFVRHDPRRYGASNYTLGRLCRHAINMTTGFSAIPLRLASLLGFVCTLFGLGILTLVLIRYFVSGGSVPGFPFLASIISIFSGAQLLSLGLLGEYLASIHFRTMQKPCYVVTDQSDEGSKDA